MWLQSFPVRGTGLTGCCLPPSFNLNLTALSKGQEQSLAPSEEGDNSEVFSRLAVLGMAVFFINIKEQ